MEATAVAHPNIALIKYWGKADVERNIPAVGSLSITLDGLTTTTRVHFDPDLGADRFALGGRPAPKMEARVTSCLDLLRRRAGVETRALVESHNDFPTAAGLASSASGFAALVVAADGALGSALATADLADLARRASGSAARSLFGGFVEISLALGDHGVVPRTEQVLEPSAWPLCVVVAVTDTAAKDVGSTEGMVRTERTSPYYSAWVDSEHLIGVPGPTIDYEWVTQWLSVRLEEMGITPASIEFDRWRIEILKKAAEENGFGAAAEWNEVGQGYRDFSPRIENFDTLLLKRQLHHGGHPLLNMAAANAIVVHDPTNASKIDKTKSTQRIDPLVAAVMAAFPVSEGQALDDSSIYNDDDRQMIM